MPISKNRFEALQADQNGGTPPLSAGAGKILSFLREHSDKAFTQSEIADETDVKLGSVGQSLVRLRERGRVDVCGDYWRVSDHEECVAAATGQAAAALAARETDEGTPRMDAWREHAVDPREHREE